MDPLYFDNSCPPELDYQSYEAPPHIPFPYNSSSVSASSSLHHDYNPTSTADGAIEGPSHHQNTDYPAPLLREAEGPDPSSRPRLTTEQTNILESKFQQDPKPPTETKKEIAQSIGLPLDKVNNWYQNRRAKAKNAKKAETYGLISMPVAPERRMSSSSASMPEDSMMKSSYSMWFGDISNMASMTGEPAYSAMTDSFPNMMAGDMVMAAPAPLLNPFDVSGVQHDWQVEKEEFNGIMRAHDQELDEMLADNSPNQMLLQQSASLLSAQYNLPSHILSSSADYSCRFQSPTMTQQHVLHGSPDSSSFAPSPQHGPVQISSRRGSGTSELASNLDTIRLQKAQQQNVNQRPLGESQLPILNLAARRKKVPGALGGFAAAGQPSNGLHAASPFTQTIAHRPASSVRRIKSTGNSLNVVSSGRVQKSGAQRSPLNVATFAEAEASNHFNAFTAPSPSTSQGTSVNGTVPMTPHTPAPMEHSIDDWSKPLVHSTSIPNMHQHQEFHSSPYSTHAASPPTDTPYIPMPPRYVTNAYSMPPQSAPAHITHFPDFSPEVHVMTGLPSGYFPPQPAPHQAYAYQMGPSIVPTQMSPVPMYQCQPQPQFYNYYQPPQFLSNSPPPVFNPGYYPVQPTPPPPPAPVQELTWMPKTEFEGPSPPPKEAEAHRPRQYEFHYMGPKDF